MYMNMFLTMFCEPVQTSQQHITADSYHFDRFDKITYAYITCVSQLGHATTT